MAATPDGRRMLTTEARGPADAAEALGRQVADQLRAQGAEEVLAP
jgi:hydroxymethylbilane synthase